MADYVYLENYSKNGKMGFSHIVFDQIAAIATSKVTGASLEKKNDDDKNKKTKNVKAFKLHRPVTCDIRNGIVSVKIDVIVNAQHNVNQVLIKIQEDVANAILSMTEIIPFTVNVKCVGIDA